MACVEYVIATRIYATNAHKVDAAFAIIVLICEHICSPLLIICFSMPQGFSHSNLSLPDQPHLHISLLFLFFSAFIVCGFLCLVFVATTMTARMPFLAVLAAPNHIVTAFLIR
jgi:hypothetical protein